MGRPQHTDGIALFYAKVYRDAAAAEGLKLVEDGKKQEARAKLKEADRWDREVKRIEQALGRARETRAGPRGRGG